LKNSINDYYVINNRVIVKNIVNGNTQFHIWRDEP
jgi:hypothetical protein